MNNFTRISLLITVVSLIVISAAIAPAQERLNDPDRIFRDELLDNLTGEWKLTRKIRGRLVENSVNVDWVLNHQFLELHYLDVATPPQYEAMAFIGFDHKMSRYVLHWLDVFGGRASGVIGYGTLDEAAHSIYFTFNNPDGSQFMNAYAFDPATKNWTSVMRQKSKGPWSLFAEDKFTPLASKP